MTDTPRRRRRQLIIALVAGALLTAAGCSGSDDKPAPQAQPSYAMAGKVAWTQGPAAAEDNPHRLAWSTPNLLVSLDRSSGLVRALDTATGQQRWTYQVPVKVNDDRSLYGVCGASSEVVGGAVAITYQRGTPEPQSMCTGLLLLDLATGKPRWSKTEHTPVGTTVEIGAGLVISDPEVPFGTGHFTKRILVTFDAATGRPRWTADPLKFGKDCDGDLHNAAQRVIAADARTIATTFDCAGGQQLWTFDPRSGRPKPGAVIEQAYSALTFVSLRSPVVLTDGTKTYVLTEDGSRVKYHLQGVGSTNVNPGTPPRLFRGRSALIVADTRYSTVAAWDLKSGDTIWYRELGKQQPQGSPATPFIAHVGDDGVVLVLGGTAEEVRIAKLDPATGEQTDLSPVLKTDLFNEADAVWWFWDGKRVIGLHDDDRSLNVKNPKPAFAIG